jgi:beta-hydroxyacyl-ACP dehydratase FabZ
VAKVYRSAKRNMLTSDASNITCLKNPIDINNDKIIDNSISISSGVSSDAILKVLNANGIEYSDKWSVFSGYSSPELKTCNCALTDDGFETINYLKNSIDQGSFMKDYPKIDMNKPPVLNIMDIMKLLPHRQPMLLVDKIMELSEQHVIGVKNVTLNEEFFKGHFPDNPVMPGVLLIEAMAQCGGVLVLKTVPDPENYLTYFMKMDNVKFKHKVLPGDTLIFKCDLISPIRRGICHMQANAYANGKLVAEAELMAQIAKKQ